MARVWQALLVWMLLVPGVLAGTPDLVDDVQRFDAEAATRKAFAGSVVPAGSRGNIDLYVIDGDYSRGESAARTAVARRFYERHGDDFDFLIAFTDFEFETGGALAFYNPVRNDVQGIGQSLFDHSALFGSDGRLQGYVDMAAIARYDFNARDPAYRRALNTLSHELMHRWGVHARYEDAHGVLRDDLLGLDGAHWSALASTEASVMYGAHWVEQSPGAWLVAESRQRFGSWDLYFAGWAAPEELAPLALIQDPSADPLGVPAVGDEAFGPATPVSIAQVIAAEGERVPDTATAQRHFDGAIMLLLRPGQPLDERHIGRLERFRTAFEQYFQAITGGRASIRLHLTPTDTAGVGTPTVIVGSPLSNLAQPIQAGLDWLIAAQQPDGQWRDRASTAARDTVAAVEALAEGRVGEVSIAQARTWLDARQPRNLDAQSWQQQGLPDRQIMTPASLGSDAGQGLLTGWTSSPSDTLRGLASRRRMPSPDQVGIAGLAGHLRALQNADGSFAPTRHGAGRRVIAASIGEQLAQLSGAENLLAAQRARDWVDASLTAAVFDEGALSVGEAAELLLRSASLGLSGSQRNELAQYLLARQGEDGDWGGSAYATALASLALMRESLPNLIPESVGATPTMPVQGQLVQLQVRVANRGGQSASPSILRWYDGDPTQGGVQLGADVSVPALLPGESRQVGASLVAPETAGPHTWHVVVDAGATVEESLEDDNARTLSFSVSEAPVAADLTLYADDLAFDPPALTSLPSTVRLSGELRNLGQTAADDVLVRATHLRPGGNLVLGEVRVSVSGRGAAPFGIDLPLTRPEAHRVEVFVDAAAEIAEAREDNNRAEKTLPFGDSIDLELVAGSLQFDATPAVGSDTEVVVRIANRGTRDAPMTRVVLERDDAGSWVELDTGALDLPVSAEVERRLQWRPVSEGSYTLRVRVDPDGQVIESDENNNAESFTQSAVTESAAALAAVSGSIMLTPDPALQGQALRVDVGVRNHGSEDATAFSVTAYRGDPRAGGAPLGTTRLESGLAASVETTVAIEIADYPERGDAQLFVHVDSGAEIVESNEQDNYLLRDFTALGLPDLAVSLASITLNPSAPAPGFPVNAAVIIGNVGEQPSESVPVRLYELAGGDRVEVGSAIDVPVLQPGETFLAEWDWTFGLLEGAQALNVEIDRDNVLREYDEHNNDATLLVDVQSGDAFVTERYFSPNGDGVRDRTRAVFADSVSAQRIIVRNHTGRTVRTLDVEPMGGGAVGAVWDGRGDDGRLQPDARYIISAESSEGLAVAEVFTILDADRAPALEAVGTADGVFLKLPDETVWTTGTQGADAERYAYTWVGPWGNGFAEDPGVYRSHRQLGGRESVVTHHWLDRYAQDHGLFSLDPSMVFPLPDGRLLLEMIEVGGDNRALFFLQQAHEIDRPVLVAALPFRLSYDQPRIIDQNRVFFAESFSESDIRVLNLETGQIVEVDVGGPDDAYHGGLEQLADGWILHSEANSRFLAYDGTPSAFPLFDPDGVEWLVDPPFGLRGSNRVLVHSARAQCVEGQGLETVRLVDAVDGTSRLLHAWPPPETSAQVCDGSPQTPGPRLRAFWLEGDGTAVVVDHAERKVLRFDMHGEPVSIQALPASLRVGPYADPDAEPVPGEARNEGCDECVGLNSSDPWYRLRLSGIGAASQVHDPSTGDLYLTLSEVVRGDGYETGGVRDYFRVPVAGEAERMGGSSTVELVDPSDQASYPYSGEYAPPAAWPKLFQDSGVRLRHDDRVENPGSGRVTAPWQHAGLADEHVELPTPISSGSALDYKRLPPALQPERVFASFSTLERLSAELQARSDGRAIVLSGLATDRNFRHFSIDRASLATPDAWQSLTPPTPTQVRFDEFMSWAPPAPGAYLFRLTVVDRAGNRRESFATADSTVGAAIENMRQDHRAISPNGDGIQDALTLSFVVLRPTMERIEVRDLAGRLFRSHDLAYGAVDIGAQQWVWDGRDDGGQRVPDGRYRVEFESGFAVRVDVDTVAPTVEALLTRPDDLYDEFDLRRARAEPLFGLGPIIDYRVQEIFAGEERATDWVFESAPLDAEEWQVFEAWRRQEYAGAYDQALLSAAQYHDRRFRLVAIDAAGNRRVRLAGSSEPAFLFLHAGRARRVLPEIQAPPRGRSVDVPLYAVTEGPDNVLLPTIVAPSREQRLFALDFGGQAENVLVDAWQSGPAGADWSTIATAQPGPISALDAGRLPQYASRMLQVSVDLSDRELHEQLTLRLRAQYPGGGEQVSNALSMQMGGVGLQCGFVDANQRQVGPYDFRIEAVLEEPVGDLAVEPRPACASSDCPPPPLRFPNLTLDGGLPRFGLPPLDVVRAQLGIPPLAVVQFRATAVDGSGREVPSAWSECRVVEHLPLDVFEVIPVIAPTCQAQPTNQVQARIGLPATPGRQYRMQFSTSAAPEPRFVDVAPTAHSTPLAPFTLNLDTGSWPEGEYLGVLQERANGGTWEPVASTTSPFFVDRVPADLQLESPATGSRVCARNWDRELAAWIDDANPVGYRFERVGSAEHVGCGGVESTDPVLDGCDGPITTGAVRRFTLTPPVGADGHYWEDLPVSGPLALRVRAFDWSGAQVCTSSQVDVDGAVEFEERSLPTPRLAASDRPVGILPGVDGPWRIGTWRWLAREQIEWSVSLHAVASGPVGEPPRIDPVALAELVTAQSALGDIDFVWDGFVGGAPVEDGRYALRFTATDDCGNERVMLRFVEVDSNPPLLDLLAPADGDSLRVVTTPIIGTAVDPHIARHEVSVSLTSVAGPWVTLASGTRSIDAASVLAHWSPGAATGLAWVRLSATDKLGNFAEVVHQVSLLERGNLLESASLDPLLFSPNGDARRDDTRLQLGLSAAVLLDAEVFDASGVRVRTLEAARAFNAGTQQLVWDGRDDLGAVVPDGRYRVDIDVSESGNPGNVDDVSLQVDVDATPPAVAVVQPVGEFARCDQTAAVEIGDVHLDFFDARLAREGFDLVAVSGRDAGVHEIAQFEGLDEAEYVLSATARDLAGSDAESERTITLDCTAPVAMLSFEGLAFRSRTGESVSITGSATDAHLLRYRLELVAEEDPDQIETLFESTEAVENGELFLWTPQQLDGDYIVRLIVEDRAGNVSVSEEYIRLDGTPPVAEISDPADGAMVTPSFEVFGTAQDNIEVDQYFLEVATPAQADAGQWSPLFSESGEVEDDLLGSVTLPLDGDFDLRLRVEDVAGNVATDRVRIRIDITPPPAPTLQAVLVNSHTARLTWQVAANDVARVLLFRNQVQRAEVSFPTASLDDSPLPEGVLRYHAVALDHAGNVSPISNVVVLTVDRTPPEVRLTASAGERIRGRYVVRGTARGQDGDLSEWTLHRTAGAGASELLRRSVDPVDSGPLVEFETTPIPDDTPVLLRLSAIDTRGNSASAEVTVVVDNGPPAAPTGLAASEQGNGVRLDWDPNTEPDLHGYLLYRGGRLIGAGSSVPADLRPFALRDNTYFDAGAPDGMLSYRVYAIDRAGNLSDGSNVAEIERDTGPPRLTLVRPRAAEVFDDALEILAVSDDRDIAQVAFFFRASGESDWSPIGAPVTAQPWRATFAPAPLPFGLYELRAVATDAGGRVDPQPPQVEVNYADLVPPAAPTELDARATGADVHLSWQPSVDSDVTQYRVERLGVGGGWSPIQTLPVGNHALVDAGRPLGEHRYRVVAIDRGENASVPSAEDAAFVFTLSLTQPYTPTAAEHTEVRGAAGARGGQLVFRVEGAGHDHAGTLAPVDARAPFALESLPIVVGVNRVSVSIEDAEGNRSIEASVQLRRGELPAAPTQLDGTLTGHAVDLTWQPSVSPQVLGYRVFRNTQALLGDEPLDQSLQAATADGLDSSLIDGDPHTTWTSGAADPTARLPAGSRVTLSWGTPELIAGLRIDYAGTASSARAWRLLGFDAEFGWVELAVRSGRSGQQEHLRLDTAYPTRMLRIEFLEAQAPNGDVEVAEIVPLQRSLEPATSAQDDVGDGAHTFQVTTVNEFGFESAPSSAWTVEVGDAEPPPPVVLSGSVAGNTVTLDWTESVAPDLRGYVVLRDGLPIASVDAGQPRGHVDSGLANGHYVYTVQAEDLAFNRSAPSNAIEFDVLTEGPGQPVMTSVEQVVDRSLHITWEAGPGTAPASYRLFVARAADNPAQPYVLLLSLFETEFDHNNLEPGAYWYRVQSLDASGNISPLSAPLGGVVEDFAQPQQPVILEPTVAGETLESAAATHLVCGVTSPGVRVRIERNGTFVAETVSGSTVAPRSLAFGTGPDLAMAFEANGIFVQQAAAVDPAQGGWFALDGTSIQPAGWGAEGGLLRGAADGSMFAVHESGEIGRFRFGEEDHDSFGSFADIVDLAASDDAERVLVLLDAAGSSVLRHAYRVGGLPTWDDIALPAGVNVRPGSLVWRAWRDEALFADTTGQVYRYDVDAQSVEVVGTGATASGPWPNPDGDAWFVIDEAGSRVIEVEDVGEDADVWLADGRLPLALAWSPDGRQVALLYADAMELRDASDGSLRLRTEIDPLPLDRGYRLDWRHPGYVLLAATVAEQAALLFEVSGRFCAPDVPMEPGENEIVAIAGHPEGEQSDPSEPILIVYEPADSENPSGDFELWEEDVLFFPLVPRIDETRLAFVPIYFEVEDGVLAFEGDLLRGTLTLPDGSQRLLRHAGSFVLEDYGQINVPLDLGVMDQLGSYVLDLSADPDDQFAEWDEDNNRITIPFEVDEVVRPRLTLWSWNAVAPPGGVLEGELEVFNPGPRLDGRVVIDIAGADEVALATLVDASFQGLSTAQRRYWSWSYNVPAQLLGGTYAVRARLLGSDGSLLGEARQQVQVSTQSEFRLTLEPQRVRSDLGEPLPVQIGVDYLQGNRVFSSGTLRLIARPAGGVDRVLWQGTTGVLLPGYALRRSVLWTAADQQPGWTDLRLEFVAENIARQASREIEFTAPGQPPSLRGSLVLQPASQWQLGLPATLALQIENAGDLPIVGASYRLRVFADDESAPLLDAVAPLALDIGGRLDAQQSIATLPQRTRAHLARLEARLADDPAGVWRRLASLTFQSVDGLPPELAVLTPPTTRPVRMPTMLALRVADRHSVVDRVEYRIDGGTWRVLGETGLQGYESSLSGLTEGEHRLDVRASDIWTNEARVDDHRFTVDLTPPQILIDGVEHGGLYNHTVAAQIEVIDAHADGYTAWLDGEAYTAGAAIAGEGLHRLRVIAVDLAGHRSERILEFTLDLTAPPLQILDPDADFSTRLRQIDVLTESEPDATVRLTLGAAQSELTADANGFALFAGVSLSVGMNLVEVQAFDAAGNASPVEARAIERLPLPGVLSGDVLPSTSAVPRGDPLGVALRFDNGTEADHLPLPWRLRALAPGDEVLFEEVANVSIVSGGIAELARQLDTATWPWGPVTLVLDVDDGAGWRLLDDALVEVLDTVAPSAAWLAPIPGSLQPRPTTIRASAQDDRGVTAVEYRVDVASWMPLTSLGGNEYGAPVDLADGTRTVDLRARDAANNQSAIAALQFVVDGTAPEIVLSGVDDGATVAMPVSVAATVIDAHPDALVLTLDGSPYVAGTPVASEGAHSVHAVATDAAGNQSERSLAFTIDTTPPTIALLQPGDGEIIKADRVLVLASTEPSAFVHLVVGGFDTQTQADANGNVAVPDVPLDLGENLIVATARDAVGNTSGPVEVRVFRSDAGPLGLTGSLATDPALVTGGTAFDLVYSVEEQVGLARTGLQMRLTVRAAGSPDVLITRDAQTDLAADGTFERREAIAAQVLALGQYVAELQVMHEGAWQVLTSQAFSIVDGASPQVSIVEPAPNSLHATQVGLRAQVVDESALEWVQARVDGGIWADMTADAGTWFALLALPNEGDLVLEVRARDVFGNQSAPVAVAVVSDQSPPLIEIDGVADGLRTRDAVTPVIIVTDASPTQQTILLNGQAFDSGTTIDDEGEFTLSVDAVDAVNWSSSTSLGFTIDRTAPPISVSYPLPGATVPGGQVDVVGQSEPLARIELEVDTQTRSTQANASGAFSFPAVPLRPGSNTLRLRALDDLDNASEWMTLDLTWAQSLLPPREIPLFGALALWLAALGMAALGLIRVHRRRKQS